MTRQPTEYRTNPDRCLIDPDGCREPNLKAIREAAHDLAMHAAQQDEQEAAALGITRGELILRRIRRTT